MDSNQGHHAPSSATLGEAEEELVFPTCQAMVEAFKEYGIPVEQWGSKRTETPQSLFDEHSPKRGARFFVRTEAGGTRRLIRRLRVACLVVVWVHNNDVKFLFEEWTQRPGADPICRDITMSETMHDGEDAFSGCCRALQEEGGLGEMGTDFAVKVWRTATVVNGPRMSSTYQGLWTVYEKHFLLVTVDVFQAGPRGEFFKATDFLREEDDHGPLTLCFSWISQSELERRCKDPLLVAFVNDSAPILNYILEEPRRRLE